MGPPIVIPGLDVGGVGLLLFARQALPRLDRDAAAA